MAQIGSLQDHVMDRMAQDMQQSIDFEILADVMCRFGWTMIKLEYDPASGQGWKTVMDWVDQVFEGDYQEHRGTWIIERSSDATAFALKWKV